MHKIGVSLRCHDTMYIFCSQDLIIDSRVYLKFLRRLYVLQNRHAHLNAHRQVLFLLAQQLSSWVVGFSPCQQQRETTRDLLEDLFWLRQDQRTIQCREVKWGVELVKPVLKKAVELIYLLCA